MLKRRVKPGRTRASGSPSRRSIRTQKEWKVEMLGVESRFASSSRAETRSRISSAALLVKVTASTADGGTRRAVMIYATRWVMTRVLPLPAPARIRSGPSVCITASRCCAFSPLRKSMRGTDSSLTCGEKGTDAFSAAENASVPFSEGVNRGTVCSKRGASMKALITACVAAAALLAGIGPAVAQTNSAQNPAEKRMHVWWRDQAPGARPYQKNARKMPLISVKGNHFEDPQGKTILFRGLAISDPDKLEMQGHWNREHFVKVKEMGAMVVRIPVHPVAWRERTPGEYFKLLDQAVDWCTELDMYIDLDWHSIGNLTTGLFQDPMYETSQQETYNFWRAMARHYAGHNTIAFFELFNEPTTYREQLGPIDWMQWKRMVEEQIAIIRAYNPQVIPLGAGFDWAYDLTPLRLAPINAPGIGYVTHPYDNKRPQPWGPKWEEDFGFAAATR